MTHSRRNGPEVELCRQIKITNNTILGHDLTPQVGSNTKSKFQISHPDPKGNSNEYF
jgi:hypothetical protein